MVKTSFSRERNGEVTTVSSAGPLCVWLCCKPHLPLCFRMQSSPIDFRVDPFHVGQMLELRNHCGPMYGDWLDEAVPCRVQIFLEPHFRCRPGSNWCL